jgi:hypothetical protein
MTCLLLVESVKRTYNPCGEYAIKVPGQCIESAPLAQFLWTMRSGINKIPLSPETCSLH